VACRIISIFPGERNYFSRMSSYDSFDLFPVESDSDSDFLVRDCTTPESLMTSSPSSLNSSRDGSPERQDNIDIDFDLLPPPILHQPSRSKNQTATGPGKKSKNIPIVNDNDWSLATHKALGMIKAISPVVITLDSFSVDAGSRYCVKGNFLCYLQIFPWFHALLEKFRQTLKTCSSQGPTIERVLEAINYFYQRRGEDYTEAELQFLGDHFQRMKIPIPSVCLSTIIDVYMEFKRFRGLHDRESADAVTPDQFRQLEIRVGILEGMVNSDSQPGTKRGRGGDRACWYPIRPCDLESCSEWCVSGGVFGLYSDGVGRLLPIDAVPVRRSIVVYSTDPDTVEAHPAPAKPNHVLVVMVGLLPPLLSLTFLSFSLRWARLQ
jgi:hypothetical protein